MPQPQIHLSNGPQGPPAHSGCPSSLKWSPRSPSSQWLPFFPQMVPNVSQPSVAALLPSNGSQSPQPSVAALLPSNGPQGPPALSGCPSSLEWVPKPPAHIGCPSSLKWVPKPPAHIGCPSSLKWAPRSPSPQWLPFFPQMGPVKVPQPSVSVPSSKGNPKAFYILIFSIIAMSLILPFFYCIPSNWDKEKVAVLCVCIM